MAQWVNCLRNNIFVNPPPLSSRTLLCEISGPTPSATGSYGRLADEIQVNFNIFKVGCRSRYSIITALPMHSVKPINCKVYF